MAIILGTKESKKWLKQNKIDYTKYFTKIMCLPKLKPAHLLALKAIPHLPFDLNEIIEPKLLGHRGYKKVKVTLLGATVLYFYWATPQITKTLLDLPTIDTEIALKNTSLGSDTVETLAHKLKTCFQKPPTDKQYLSIASRDLKNIEQKIALLEDHQKKLKNEGSAKL